MRILHVISCLTVGGAQRLVSSLLPELIKHEKVDLLVYKRVNTTFEKELIGAGVNIISLDVNNTRNPISMVKMRRVFAHYDIIHAHLFPTVYWVALASIGLNIKLIYTEHNTFNRRRNKAYLRPIEKFIYSRYTTIISITDQVRSELSKWLQSDDSRFVTIPNGINTSYFSVNDEIVDKNRIIMIARFAPAKDQATLIRALTFLNKEIKVRLVGDGETRLECENLARDLGVYHQIEFMGEQSDIPRLIAQSYIGVQSSHWEGFGLTAVEMMAASKPVIASNVEGLRQVVEGAGVLFHHGDEKDLAKAIDKLIGDPNYYKEVSLACKERSMKFDISKMAQKYIEVYTNM